MQMRRECGADANEGIMDETIWVQSDGNAMEVKCEERQKTAIWLEYCHFAAEIGKVQAEMWIFAVRWEWGYCFAVSSPQGKGVRDIADW
jgi:hypothetical protein